ncbi:MAG: type II secretion system protein GspD [Planctomycetes bacterium]|nr:type II secretion system protein GspD [Planctomycetota bacterium]
MYREKNSKDKTKIRNKLFVWCIVLALMAAISVADVGRGPAEADLWANAGTAEIRTSGRQASVLPSGMIPVFNCEENFGVRKALALLSSICQKNIVPTPNVDGVLAFRRLTNVTFDEAMDAILGDNFKYEQRGSLIRVYTKDEYKKIKEDPDRKIYKIFTLYYISAAEAQNLITPVLSSDTQIQVSSPAETGISGGAGSSSGGRRSSGGRISSGGGGSITSGGGDSMALNDTIVVYDYPENIEKAQEIIKAIDVRPKQVLVEATILSVLLTEEMKLGVDLNLLAGVSLDGTSSTDQIGSTSSLLTTTTTPILQVAAGVAGSALETSGFASVIGGSGLRIGVRSGSVTAFITALESITDTTVLANPKILAVNKQEGKVLIGRNLGYRSSTTISTGGIATEGEVKFLQTGTVLVFRPFIGNDGYIRMDIYPKDSSAIIDNDGVPQETTTELSTNILVKDGETIVIGGLFRDVVVTSRSQIPLLGDLPFIGALFRSTSDSTRREEVIILLTTHIIEEPSELEGEARADDVRRKRFGAKEELQWMGKARLVEDRYAKAARYYVDGDTEAAMKELDYVLELRPSYLEAIRLKERIIAETNPDELDMIERIMLGDIEREDSDKWLRR